MMECRYKREDKGKGNKESERIGTFCISLIVYG